LGDAVRQRSGSVPQERRLGDAVRRRNATGSTSRIKGALDPVAAALEAATAARSAYPPELIRTIEDYAKITKGAQAPVEAVEAVEAAERALEEHALRPRKHGRRSERAGRNGDG